MRQVLVFRCETREPDQYLKFADHRLRPGLELMENLPAQGNPRIIYDLGCGTGQLTQILADRYPQAQVIGLDNSADMLEKARVESTGALHPETQARPPVQWVQADIGTWVPPEPPDLIYSNATLHWLSGHAALFPRLAECLSPGGWLSRCP